MTSDRWLKGSWTVWRDSDDARDAVRYGGAGALPGAPAVHLRQGRGGVRHRRRSRAREGPRDRQGARGGVGLVIVRDEVHRGVLWLAPWPHALQPCGGSLVRRARRAPAEAEVRRERAAAPRQRRSRA